MVSAATSSRPRRAVTVTAVSGTSGRGFVQVHRKYSFLLGSVGETEQVCRDHGAGPVGDVGVVGE